MVFSLLMTLIWSGLVFYLYREGTIASSSGLNGFKKLIVKSVANPKKSGSVIVIAAFALFLLLPLIWGLTFYLKSDINVLIVIGFMAWVYKWFKFLFISEERES